MESNATSTANIDALSVDSAVAAASAVFVNDSDGVSCPPAPSRRSITNTEARNRAFVRRALAILSDHIRRRECITRKELIEKTLASRPPCYFVEFEHAVRVVGYLLDNPGRCGTNASAAMWEELATKVRALVEGPRKLRRTKALSFVLNFDRPSRYFLTFRQASRILGRLVGERRSATIVTVNS